MDRTSASAAALVLAAVFLLGAFAAIPHPAAAQVTSSLAGSVCAADPQAVGMMAPASSDPAGCGVRLAGAQLHLTKPGVGGTAVGAVDQKATSDGNGTYAFPNITDGTYSLAVARTGFASATVNVTVSGATARDVGLRPVPVVVDGKVTKASGAPVAGAQVSVCCGPTTGGSGTTTDAGGAFELKVDAGERTFGVDVGGYRVLSQGLFVDGTQPVSLVVPTAPRPDAWLHGTVTDQVGNPVAGLTLTSYSNGYCCPVPYAGAGGTATASGGSAGPSMAPMQPYYYGNRSNSTATDAAGRYTLGVFGGSGVSLSAYREGYVGYNKYLQVAPGEDRLLDIHLLKYPPKTAHLQGQVVDAATGQGLPYVSISVQSPAYGPSECSQDSGAAQGGGYGTATPTYATASGTAAPPPANGQPATESGTASTTASSPTGAAVMRPMPYYNPGCAIAFSADGTFAGNVTPGYAIVQVNYESYRACPPKDGTYAPCQPEYYTWTQAMTLPANQATTLTVRLQQRPGPDATVSGYLLDDSSGKPIPGGQVTFSSQDGYGYGSATTDQDGSYRIRIRSGPFDVTASAEGHLHWAGTVVVKAGETPLDLRLPPGEEANGCCCCIAYGKGVAADGVAPAPAAATTSSTGASGPGAPAGQSASNAAIGGAGGSASGAAFEDLHGGLGPYDAAARSKAAASASTTGHASPAAGPLALLALIGCAAWLRRR